MRRLPAALMVLGALLAALGVLAVAGIERIDLPPAAVRAIAATLPVVVLLAGVVLLLVGALVARLARREAEQVGRGVAGVSPGRGASALREPRDVPAAGRAGAVNAAPSGADRVT